MSTFMINTIINKYTLARITFNSINNQIKDGMHS